MKNEIFVPGRLCLFGEHSDWAGKYRTMNADIEPGAAIVTGTEQGITATKVLSRNELKDSILKFFTR
ncbi:MAG: galactokinase family protein [Duncaniella sp.]|nr:galactokinase family protein [Duncaniella sp.]